MKIDLIYSTPNYHKLVETIARVCYQSYDKESETSHRSIRAIMSKGHLSISSVGNIVFNIKYDKDSYSHVLEDLSYMQEINQFIKWTTPFSSKSSGEFYVSMNMLTFLDLYNTIGKEEEFVETFQFMLDEVNKVPELRWFYDKTVELPASVNEYTGKGQPKLYEPVILDEDWTKLKALGFNDYELGVHATLTINFITDRAMSLQLWRHWSGGCELSQRYVSRTNAEYRLPLNIDHDIRYALKDTNIQLSNTYDYILRLCKEKGIREGRAKEIARSILPNDTVTQLIQCRPFRNWEHLFKLRDDKHAQIEVQKDVKSIKQKLNDLGVDL